MNPLSILLVKSFKFFKLILVLLVGNEVTKPTFFFFFFFEAIGIQIPVSIPVEIKPVSLGRE